MADTKVSSLVPASTLNASDYLLLVQNGNSLKIDIQTLLSHLPTKTTVLETPEYPTSGVLSTGILVSKLTATLPNVEYSLPVGTHGMEKQLVIDNIQNSVRSILSSTWVGSVATLTTGVVKTITAATWATGVVTITSTAHGLSNGDTITFAGFTPSTYNGSYIITVTSVDQFTYSNITNPGTIVTVGSGLLGNTHNYSNNDTITITDTIPSGYNGTYSITTTNPYTFTYSLPSDPGNTTVNGVASGLGTTTVNVTSGAGFSTLKFNSYQSTACVKNLNGMWYLMSTNSLGIV